MDNQKQDIFREELNCVLFKPTTPLKAEYNDSTGRVICFCGTVKAYHPDHIELLLEENNPPVQIREGNELIIVLGEEDSQLVHYYRSKILAKHPDKLMTIDITPPQETNVRALRCYFRCDLSIPFSYIIEKVLEFQGQTKNLSAGGLLGIIKYDSTLTVDTVFDIRFKLPEGTGPLTLPSQIVRIEKAPKSMLLIGVKFIKISDAQQNQIIKYLFQYEREMKTKRGLR